MSFKMIREAQTLARLGDRAKFAQTVQKIIGADSVTSIREVFDQTEFEVTPAHYNQWLETILDIAAERGVNLSNRSNFNDIAFDILDNDSLVDALGGDSEKTKTNILKALWQSYQVSKAHTKVQDHVGKTIQRAREEEEAVNDLAGSEDEEGGFAQALNAAKGTEDEEKTSSRKDKTPIFQRVMAKGAKNPYPPHTLRAALWDDAHTEGVEDEEYDELELTAEPDQHEMEPELDKDSMSPDELAGHITGEAPDLESRVDDLEDRIADLEHDEVEVDVTPDSDEGLTDDIDPEGEPSFDEEEQTKSIFRTAITSPKEHLSAALKAVEDEGAKAWAGMQVPTNPHPKKSQAYNAWAKGFKNSAKGGLGIVDKMFPSKQKPKKR